VTSSNSEQLAWEARAGRFAAAAAAASGLLLLVGSFYFNTTVRERPRGDDQLLSLFSREGTHLVIAGVLVALGYLLLGVVLAYLYRVTRRRRPELPRAALPLIVFGALIGAASEVGRQIAVLGVASEFLGSAERTADAARGLVRGSTALQIIAVAGLSANFALGLTLGLVCINSMRAGLLSRFMGIFGTALGVLAVVAAAPFRLLSFPWLLALAALFLDRWPGGRGRAWETDEAVPWPTVSQRNEEIARQREDMDGGDGEGGRTDADADPGDGASGNGRPDDPAGPQPGEAEAGATGGGPTPPSKRKRGRRR
jgi:hypothetical protein